MNTLPPLPPWPYSGQPWDPARPVTPGVEPGLTILNHGLSRIPTDQEYPTSHQALHWITSAYLNPPCIIRRIIDNPGLAATLTTILESGELSEFPWLKDLLAHRIWIGMWPWLPTPLRVASLPYLFQINPDAHYLPLQDPSVQVPPTQLHPDTYLLRGLQQESPATQARWLHTHTKKVRQNPFPFVLVMRLWPSSVWDSIAEPPSLAWLAHPACPTPYVEQLLRRLAIVGTTVEREVDLGHFFPGCPVLTPLPLREPELHLRTPRQWLRLWISCARLPRAMYAALQLPSPDTVTTVGTQAELRAQLEHKTFTGLVPHILHWLT